MFSASRNGGRTPGWRRSSAGQETSTISFWVIRVVLPVKLLADLRITRNDHVVDALHLVEQLHPVPSGCCRLSRGSPCRGSSPSRPSRDGSGSEANNSRQDRSSCRRSYPDMDHRPGIGAFVARFVTRPVRSNPLGGRSGRSLRVGLRRLVRFADADDDRISLMENQPGAVGASRRISSTGAFCRCGVIPLTALIQLLL